MSEEQQQRDVAINYIDRIAASGGTNRDAKGLGTMTVGRWTVGAVAAISGEDGKEVPEFVPTLHELKQLASYWMREQIDHDFQWFAYQQTGSSEWRWSVFISRRLSRLAEVLDEQAMQRARKDAVARYRHLSQASTTRNWSVFTTGTEQEQEAWRTKLWNAMSSGSE